MENFMSKKKNEQDFLKSIHQAGESFARETRYRIGSFNLGAQPDLMDSFLIVYKTEGYSGGNCYDGVASYYCNTLEERIDSAESELGFIWQFDDAFFQFNKVEFRNYLEDMITQAEEKEVFLAEDTESEYYGNNTTRRLITADFQKLISFLGNKNAAQAFIQGFEQTVPEMKFQLKQTTLVESINNLKRECAQAERNIINHDKDIAQADKKLLSEKQKLLKRIAEIDSYFANQTDNHMQKLVELQDKFAQVHHQLDLANQDYTALTGEIYGVKKAGRRY